MDPSLVSRPVGDDDGCGNDADNAWVMVCAVLVLGMMPALAFFESGMLRCVRKAKERKLDSGWDCIVRSCLVAGRGGRDRREKGRKGRRI